jgi:hypothetical protein
MTQLKPVMKRSPQSHSRIASPLARIAFVFGVLFLALLIGAAVAGAAAVRSLKRASNPGSLHGELLACLDADSLSRVEIIIPGWAATIGRVGASLADVDPQVQAALQAIGGGQVGVYKLAERPPRHKVLGMLNRADQELEPDGWTRMVTVLDHGEFVAIYGLDSSMRPGKAVKIFVLVMNQQELVMVSARAFPAPLLELASAELAEVRLGERLR